MKKYKLISSSIKTDFIITKEMLPKGYLVICDYLNQKTHQFETFVYYDRELSKDELREHLLYFTLEEVDE